MSRGCFDYTVLAVLAQTINCSGKWLKVVVTMRKGLTLNYMLMVEPRFANRMREGIREREKRRIMPPFSV